MFLSHVHVLLLKKRTGADLLFLHTVVPLRGKQQRAVVAVPLQEPWRLRLLQAEWLNFAPPQHFFIIVDQPLRPAERERDREMTSWPQLLAGPIG